MHEECAREALSVRADTKRRPERLHHALLCPTLPFEVGVLHKSLIESECLHGGFVVHLLLASSPENNLRPQMLPARHTTRMCVVLRLLQGPPHPLLPPASFVLREMVK
ncbi:uncharacterized [Tachysurus ichikawai]